MMEIIRVQSIFDIVSSEETAITIGNFDGVHLGHQLLIKDTLEISRKKRYTSCVLTFDPHPLVILAPKFNLLFLTTLHQKIELIEEMGIDRIYIIEFSDLFSKMEFDDFFNNFIQRGLKARDIVVGENFCFGKDRKGDIEKLKMMCEFSDIRLHTHKCISKDGELINSSMIRRCIKEGNIKKATQHLGRYYSVSCNVVHGCGLGQELGFPTANLDFREMVIPADGIYASFTTFDGKCFKSVVNIGLCPTFERQSRSFEVHILDFHNQLYDKKITVDFVDRIRNEEKFTSKEALTFQIQKDTENAREILRSQRII